MRFEFHLPTKVIFYPESLEVLGEETAKLGGKCLVVTGRTFARKYGYIDKMRELLEANNVKVEFFSRVEPNPSFQTVKEGAKLVKKIGVDVIVGFGGGSAMDAAKAIALLASKGGDIRGYVGVPIDEEDVIPIIAVPTTCGTGSEVTRYSVLTDVENKRKVVVLGYSILPRTAILDPTILKHLPSHLVAYTGFDALSHAMEAFISKKSQPVSDIFALESIRLIFQYMEKAVKGDFQALEMMHYASMLAGVAINFAGTTIVHGLGYYLTAYHDVHHGLANALLLPHVLEFNAPAVPEKIERMAEVLKIPSDRLVGKVIELRKAAGVPESLRKVGVSENEIGKMVEEAMTYSRNLENNPREVTPENVEKIYRKAFI